MLAYLSHLMYRDENEVTDRRGPSDGPVRTPLSSNKIREKLQKLAEWRLDPSSIEFEQDASEFHGGYAMVSRAFLVPTFGIGERIINAAYIFYGRKPTTRKPIAVKKMKIENGKDKERVLGLALREARFLTELSHENVIKLEGFVEDISGDKIWLVLPWAANGNLKDFVALEEWEIPERISLMNDVTNGVEYLHSRDPPIHHGDLKSANVLVNLKCRAVITDFGSARRVAKRDPNAKPYKRENRAQPAMLLETEFCEATNTITLTGNNYTLRWAAPELLLDDEAGLWSDIWALGWIFYEVMMNAIPFQNVRNDSMVVVQVIQGNLPSVADHVRMALIRKLYWLMIACWSINPNRQRAANMSGSQTRSPELLIQMGNMHRFQNDYINASKFLTEALGICTETADNAVKAEALFGLAEVNRGQGNYSKAVQHYSEVIEIYTDTGNLQGRASTLKGLAAIHRLQGQYEEATTFYYEVVEICTEIDNKNMKAEALWGLAEVCRAENAYGAAVKFYSEVTQICTEIGNRGVRADALLGLAEVHRAQDRCDSAVSLYSEVVEICTDLGHRQRRADALWGLAQVHRLQKQYSQAFQLLSEVLQSRIDTGDRLGRAWALMGLADIYHDQDDHGDAIRLYEQAAEIFGEIGATQGLEKALGRAASSRREG